MLFEELLEIKEHQDNPDRPGESCVMGKNTLGLSCNPVPARAGHLRHRHHQRLLFAQPGQCIQDILGGGSRATPGVHPQYHPLHRFVLLEFPDVRNEGLRTDGLPQQGMLLRLAVDNRPFEHQHRNLFTRLETNSSRFGKKRPGQMGLRGPRTGLNIVGRAVDPLATILLRGPFSSAGRRINLRPRRIWCPIFPHCGCIK